MKKRATEHHIDALAALLLFGIFAVCVLAVLLTGAGAYRRLTQRDGEEYSRRSCIQYVATRVRQSDTLDGVAVEPFGETQALVFRDEEEYVTRIYYYDGYIMELYCPDGDDGFMPEDGEKIIEAGALELEKTGALLHIETVDSEGSRDSLWLSLRCGEGEPA